MQIMKTELSIVQVFSELEVGFNKGTSKHHQLKTTLTHTKNHMDLYLFKVKPIIVCVPVLICAVSLILTVSLSIV